MEYLHSSWAPSWHRKPGHLDVKRINEHPRLESTSAKSLFAKEASSFESILFHPQDEKVWGKSRTSSHGCLSSTANGKCGANPASLGGFGWVWVGGGAIYDPPLPPLHYTCDEINILFNCPNLLKFRFRSSRCTEPFRVQNVQMIWPGVTYLNPDGWKWTCVSSMSLCPSVVFHAYPLTFSTILAF